MSTNLKVVPVVRLVREEQLENMEFMLATFCVSSGVKSRLVRPEQPANIPLMYVTFCVSSGVKSKLVRLEQPANM